jgi:ABC-type multidrug transport system fused ATPase/permease subunit
VPDLLATSAATWRDRTLDPPVLPPELAVLPRGASLRERIRGLRDRHRLRRERAERVYADSRSPARGWPVADERTVVRFVVAMIRERRRSFAALVVLNACAAGAALAVPRLLGQLIDRVTAAGPATGLGSLSVVILAVVAAQAVFTFAGQITSTLFGQNLLASMREYVVQTILRLPLSRVEGASTGDLVTRVTRDVGTMSRAVQFGLPTAVITMLTVGLSVAAMLLNSVLLALPAMLVVSGSAVQVRRYLRRASVCYIAEGATYSRINTTLTETVEGARTVEALGLARRRVRAGEDDIAVSGQAERYGMTLRNLLFAVIDITFNAPRVITVLVGSWGYWNGHVTLGQITAAVLYVEALSGPLDRLVGEVDRLQVGAASTARLLGIATVPSDRVPGTAVPVGTELVARELRFAYRPGHDVLHGVDIRPRVGERIAVVGPSGSGKSTLGRLLAGINGPRTGSVRVGGVELVTLPLESLREEVALVTQEHHVFVGSVRDNIVLGRETADDDAVWAALRAVGSEDWVRRLPEQLDTRVGSGNLELTPAQAQQVAMARLVIADPHTLVLDEATSLIDPRTARTLEGSVHALLTGRTVIAIAHRLHTAHDADRIAVVIGGRIVEMGSHDELVALEGEYAALWRAWTS